MVLAAFLTLFVFVASYSQYRRPSTVVPGSTADKTFDNADRIHREATQKPVSTNNKQFQNNSSTRSGSTNSNSLNTNKAPQKSDDVLDALRVNKFQVALDKEQASYQSNSSNYSIDRIQPGESVYFKDDRDGGLYLEGRMVGLFKTEAGIGNYLVMATPYLFNGSGYENSTYLFFVSRQDSYNSLQSYNYSTGAKKLDDKFKALPMDATTRQLILNETIAEDSKRVALTAQREKNAPIIENSLKDIQSNKDHPQVFFIKEENTANEELTSGYKLLVVCPPDSAFILTETVVKSKWAIYLVDFKSTPGRLNSKLIMSLTEAQLKPSTTKVENWQTSNYLAEAEKLLNKKLGKISVQKYNADAKKEYEDREKKKELDWQNEKAKSEKIVNDYKAKRKPLGSMAMTAPTHSLISFYPAYEDYHSVDKGYKLDIKAKDSIFILPMFNATSTVVLIDQKTKPGNDEGVVFTEINLNYAYGRSYFSNEVPYQEDIIREIEKSIYNKLHKPIPDELSKKDLGTRLIIEGLNWYDSDVFAWMQNCNIPKYYYSLEPFGYYEGFGTGKFLNYTKKSYNQNNKGQRIVDENEDYLGGIHLSGEKSGLGIKRFHDPEGYFKGVFSFNNNADKLDSIGISFYNEQYRLHTTNGKITISKNGQIQVDAGVIWKDQEKILIDSNGHVSLPETNILRTPSSMIITEEFTNGYPKHQCLILYKNGDIYCGSVNNALEKIGMMGMLFKKNGDFYYLIDIIKDRVMTPNGLYIPREGNLVYKGVLIDGKPDIWGEMLDIEKKEKYIGPLKDGKRNGFGQLFSVDPNNQETMNVKYVIYKDGVLQR